jgi:hypothetical protein
MTTIKAKANEGTNKNLSARVAPFKNKILLVGAMAMKKNKIEKAIIGLRLKKKIVRKVSNNKTTTAA